MQITIETIFKALLLLIKEHREGLPLSKSLIESILTLQTMEEEIAGEQTILSPNSIVTPGLVRKVLEEIINGNMTLFEKDKLTVYLAGLLKDGNYAERITSAFFETYKDKLPKEVANLDPTTGEIHNPDYEHISDLREDLYNTVLAGRYVTRMKKTMRALNVMADKPTEIISMLEEDSSTFKELLEQKHTGNKQLNTTIDKLTEILDAIKESRLGTTRLKVGMDIINTYTSGGFIRGSATTIMGMRGRFKSGLLKLIFAQLCTYNKPAMKDPSKTPIIVFFSFEETEEVILEFIYTYFYYLEFGIKPDLTTVNSREVAEYVDYKLTRLGYTYKIEYHPPGTFSTDDVNAYIRRFKDNNYELHAFLTDYYTKVTASNAIRTFASYGGADIKRMYTVMRGKALDEGFAFITPHQYSSGVYSIDKLYPKADSWKLIQEVVGKDYAEGSSTIATELDIVLDCNLCFVNEFDMELGEDRYKAYLGVGLSKTKDVINIIDENVKVGFISFPDAQGVGIMPDVYYDPITDTVNSPDGKINFKRYTTFATGAVNKQVKYNITDRKTIYEKGEERYKAWVEQTGGAKKDNIKLKDKVTMDVGD